ILDQMADAVLVADADGRIVLANRAASALYGLPVDELLLLQPPNRPWRVLRQDGRPLEPADNPYNRAVNGQATQAECRDIAVGGGERLEWVPAVPLRDQARPVGGAVG